MPPQTITPLILFILLLLSPANGSSHPNPNLPVTQSPTSRLTLFATRDLARHRLISQYPRHGSGSFQLKPSLCSREVNSSVRVNLYSAAEFGVGEYLAELEIGTPPRRVQLFADTGSDLTWVKCQYRTPRGLKRIKRVYQAYRSSSFETVSCGSKECTQGLADLFSLTTCPVPSAPCLYNYSYGSSSLVAFGIFGKEIITLPQENHHKVKLSNIVGCTESTQGSSSAILNGSDGILGLSYSNQSFGYQAAMKYGHGKFSYCLVDHLSPTNKTGFLAFSDSNHIQNIRHTKLFLQAIIGFYAVSIKGISIGGSMLDIPGSVWDVRGPGGTILDSGTSLTVLATPAYTAVMDTLSKALLPRFPRLEQTQPFNYCFNSTGFKESMVPRLVIHFSDGVRFEPYVKSYIIDDRPNVKCVGILEGPGVPYLSVLGNILQQNYLWEYDLVKEKLGFGASTCRS